MTNGDDLAYPLEETLTDKYGGEFRNQYYGLSKHELFAAMAKTGEYDDYGADLKANVVGRQAPSWSENTLDYIKWEAEFEAIVKCIKADALINELNKQP